METIQGYVNAVSRSCEPVGTTHAVIDTSGREPQLLCGRRSTDLNWTLNPKPKTTLCGNCKRRMGAKRNTADTRWQAYEAELDGIIAQHIAELNAMVGKTIRWSHREAEAVVVAVSGGPQRYGRKADYNPGTLHVESAAGVRNAVPFENYKTFKKYNP